MNQPTRSENISTASVRLSSRSWLGILARPALRLLLILAAILLVGAVLRFYRLADFTLWAGDQARDMTLMRQMVHTGQPMLLGSGSSAGNYYRGPAYYYLQLVPFLLTDGDPVAAAGLVAFFDLGTTLLLFVVGRKLFNQRVGLYAAAFWSISPLVITTARNAWNPNLIALFTMLMILSLVEIAEGRIQYFCLLVPAWTMAWQMHEQALLLLPAVVLVLVWLRPRIDIRTAVTAISLGALTMAPLLAYDFSHQLANTRGLIGYLLHPPEVSSYGSGFLSTLANKLWSVLLRADSLMPAPDYLHIVWLLLTSCGLVWAIVRIRRGGTQLRGARLFASLLITPVLYGLWPGNITYPHYMIIIYPLVFFLLGLGVDSVVVLFTRAAVVMQVAAAALILLGASDILMQTSGRNPEAMSYGATKAVVDYITVSASNRPFALHLNSQLEMFEGYDQTYLYLFDRLKAVPSVNPGLDTYVVYDPQNLRDGSLWPGELIDGIKVAHLDPGALGPALVGGDFVLAEGSTGTGWVMPGPGRWNVISENGSHVLVMQAGRATFSVSTPKLNPGSSYLVSVDHQNSLGASLWASAEVRDLKGELLGRFPMQPGSARPILVRSDRSDFFLPASVDSLTRGSTGYRTDMFRVEVPRQGARLSITFSNENDEDIRLRHVQLREMDEAGR